MAPVLERGHEGFNDRVVVRRNDESLMQLDGFETVVQSLVNRLDPIVVVLLGLCERCLSAGQVLADVGPLQVSA